MSVARNWREMPQRYRLEAVKCKKCGRIHYPPRLICLECGNREFENIKLSDRGQIVSFSIIRTPPSQFKDQSPYALGIIEMEGGGRLMTQIVDMPFEKIDIGVKVRLEFRRIQQEGASGILCYGHKAVPA